MTVSIDDIDEFEDVGVLELGHDLDFQLYLFVKFVVVVLEAYFGHHLHRYLLFR